MRKSTLVVLLALGATATGFVIASIASSLQGPGSAATASIAAPPQKAALGWHETFGSAGQRLVFTVDSLQVVPSGWRARIGIANDTTAAYYVGDPRAKLAQATYGEPYGLMLLATGSHAEMLRRNNEGTLPAPRPALSFDPRLPDVLEAGGSWKGTISAPGALVAGSWVRAVFGAIVAVSDKPPRGAPTEVAWITDHAYRLRN